MGKQKGMYSSTARSHSIRKMQAIKICPVTNGLPTTMTLEGFQAACERCREQDRHGYNSGRPYKFTWCDTCQGNSLPSELKLLKLAQFKRQHAVQQYLESRGMRTHSPAK